ncbi:hypothetical protein MF1_10930 [Bartonella quintana]|uniref:5-formyltetrahydrofolate cyclo-ligase n=1 Tax=Bartonella quintana TaxID=803 RepID=UPI00131909B4|nr:hypothetical protein MF1_10930 [Bartonella quintana]
MICLASLIIVPLSAFDNQWHRLGLGRGDTMIGLKLLKKQGHQINLWDLGFSCQEVSSIPHAEHDLILQGIFTEKGFLKR